MLGTWIGIWMLILATNQVGEVWHHSVLFAYPRSIAQLEPDVQWLPKWLTAKLWQLLNCPWCCSVWFALAVIAIGQWPITSWSVYALAISRGANIVNDILKSSRKSTE